MYVNNTKMPKGISSKLTIKIGFIILSIKIFSEGPLLLCFHLNISCSSCNCINHTNLNILFYWEFAGIEFSVLCVFLLVQEQYKNGQKPIQFKKICRCQVYSKTLRRKRLMVSISLNTNIINWITFQETRMTKTPKILLLSSRLTCSIWAFKSHLHFRTDCRITWVVFRLI